MIQHWPALLTADWHLRPWDRIWPQYPDLVGDNEYAIQQLRELVSKYQVGLVFLAGDVIGDCDVADATSGLKLINDFGNDLYDLDAKLLYVLGQHDMSNPPIVSSVDRNAVYMHKQLRTYDDVSIYGLNYVRKSEMPAELPTADILVTHQKWIEFMGPRLGDFSIKDFNFKIICSGDFHKHVSASIVREDGSTISLLSPGSICTQKIDEPAEHSVWLLQQSLDFVSVPIKSRGKYDFTISTNEILIAFLDAWHTLPASMLQQDVPLNISKNIVRIRYNPDIPKISARLRECITDTACLFENPDPRLSVNTTHYVLPQHHTALSGDLSALLSQIYVKDNRLDDAQQLLAAAMDGTGAIQRRIKNITDRLEEISV